MSSYPRRRCRNGSNSRHLCRCRCRNLTASERPGHLRPATHSRATAMDDTPSKVSPSRARSKESPPAVSPGAVLTADELLSLIQFKKVSQPLRVKGRVEDVGTWKGQGFGYCYGD